MAKNDLDKYAIKVTIWKSVDKQKEDDMVSESHLDNKLSPKFQFKCETKCIFSSSLKQPLHYFLTLWARLKTNLYNLKHKQFPPKCVNMGGRGGDKSLERKRKMQFCGDVRWKSVAFPEIKKKQKNCNESHVYFCLQQKQLAWNVFFSREHTCTSATFSWRSNFEV